MSLTVHYMAVESERTRLLSQQKRDRRAAEGRGAPGRRVADLTRPVRALAGAAQVRLDARLWGERRHRAPRAPIAPTCPS